jgi:hypothetical protein
MNKKRSVSNFRFIVGFPFGLLAETFARLAIKISGGQLDVDFNYIDRYKYRDKSL